MSPLEPCLGPPPWCAAMSPTGTSIATWLSDILSFAAIGLALWVFVREQKRFNAERQKAETDRRARLSRFIDASIELAHDMRERTAGLVANLSAVAGSQAIEPDLVPDFLKERKIAVDATWIFRLKAPEDVGIAKCLARIQRTGEEAREVAKKRAPGEMATFLRPLVKEFEQEAAALEQERPSDAPIGPRSGSAGSAPGTER